MIQVDQQTIDKFLCTVSQKHNLRYDLDVKMLALNISSNFEVLSLKILQKSDFVTKENQDNLFKSIKYILCHSNIHKIEFDEDIQPQPQSKGWFSWFYEKPTIAFKDWIIQFLPSMIRDTKVVEIKLPNLDCLTLAQRRALQEELDFNLRTNKGSWQKRLG